MVSMKAENLRGHHPVTDTEKRPLQLVPYGLIVTRTWLLNQGVPRYRIDNWVRRKELKSLSPGVFTRPDLLKLTWQGVVCSLQRMGSDLIPGGLTAIDLLGAGHYLTFASAQKIHLYGTDPLPAWINKIVPGTVFIRHNSRRLFRPAMDDLAPLKQSQSSGDPVVEATQVISWGIDDWPLTISSLERACLEVLLDVPKLISFEYTDQLLQGMTSLSPDRLNHLLDRCHNVKAKRLFLWFAEKQNHPWLKKLDRGKFSLEGGALGAGKRRLIKGGKLDPKYLITIPREVYEME